MNDVKYVGVNSPNFHIHKMLTYDPLGNVIGEVYELYINYEYQNTYATLDDALQRVKVMIIGLGSLK